MVKLKTPAPEEFAQAFVAYFECAKNTEPHDCSEEIESCWRDGEAGYFWRAAMIAAETNNTERNQIRLDLIQKSMDMFRRGIDVRVKK